MASKGRPLIYETREALQTAIDNYFEDCDTRTREVVENGVAVEKKAPIIYTIEGLALALGMDRRNLIEYDKREIFYPIIKNAKIKCLAKHTEKALSSEVNTTFSIFLFKNNYGYRDRVEHQVDVSSNSQQVQDLSKLDDKELAQLRELTGKIGTPYEPGENQITRKE